MHDDNASHGIVNTDQDRVNPAADSPTYSTTTGPFDGSYPHKPPQSNDQSPAVASPDPTPASKADIAQPGDRDSQLQSIKRDALQHLLPIVGKLDQPPEERFQTLLMVIQASDNQQLINEAYETATKIQDDAKRAQALLAIINEVDYFTQSSQQTV